jgi:HK97 family phage portal protein
MSLLQRLFGKPERRRSLSVLGGYGFAPLSSGGATIISAKLAENLAAVCACVDAIAGTLSTLPVAVFEESEGARVETSTHPVARLVKQPNSRQSWCDWLAMMLASTLLQGNGLSVIERDGRGAPTTLLPVPWSAVLPVLLPSGRLAFDVVSYYAPAGFPAVPSGRFLDDEVFLLRDRSDDGWLGKSRLSRAPAALEGAIGLQQFSNSMWRNGVTLSGVLKHPGALSTEAKDYISRSFAERFSGAANAHKVPILEEGLEYTPIGVSPEDAEILASRRLSVEDIARLFGVPPPIIQDYSHGTFTNSAQAALWFAQLSLTPWARRIEAEFLRSVFSDPSGPYHLEIDLSGLTRGDYQSRWATNIAAVQAGILTRDEVRSAEGYGPLPEGAPEPAEPAPAEGANAIA